MKIMDVERQASVTATTEDEEYPVDNLLDDRPGKKWKSTGTSATVTVAVDAGGSEAVFVGGIVADSVTVTVKSTDEVTTYATEAITLTRDQLWLNFTRNTAALHVLLAFSVSSGVCEAGVVRVGDVSDWPNPLYGVPRKYRNNSILLEKASGGMAVHQRKILRRLSLALQCTDAEANALETLWLDRGNAPLPMLLLDGMDAIRQQWCGLFHMDGDGPELAYTYLDFHTINLPLREAY